MSGLACCCTHLWRDIGCHEDQPKYHQHLFIPNKALYLKSKQLCILTEKNHIQIAQNRITNEEATFDQALPIKSLKWN